ncbi:hypothetical protein [Bradyrhizobium sp. SZCCHNPS2010]|uniref:hypothetical protein n=1 Tax=Bradyrhizobium sp. SZCCHNPS2010 TaxID=3057333 RepID=UPI002916D376|nr:hypothetical protein [Bradyrhizobium sp. SZCCHNPS2010]
MTTTTVTTLREDEVFVTGWTDCDPHTSLSEMYRKRAKLVVGLWIKADGGRWQWEVYDVRDQVLESGREQSDIDARTAAEASAKRILLAA